MVTSLRERLIKGGKKMKNLEYLKKVKDENVDYEVVRNVLEHEIEYRKMKALEIIAEELCKFNLTTNVLSSVIEAVTNQGNSLNVNGLVYKDERAR